MMCISLRHLFSHSPQVFEVPDLYDQDDGPEEDRDMKKGSITSDPSDGNSSNDNNPNAPSTSTRVRPITDRRASNISQDSNDSYVSSSTNNLNQPSTSSGPLKNRQISPVKLGLADSKTSLPSLSSLPSIDSSDRSSTNSDISSCRPVYPRKSSLRRKSSAGSGGARRVSFHDQVNVRMFPLEEAEVFVGTPASPTIPPENVIDDIDRLTEEVSSRITKVMPKDAPVPSLEDICEAISTADLSFNATSSSPTTTSNSSKGGTPTQPANQQDSDFEEVFAEMDLFMRINFPRYYSFLRAHILTGAVGSEGFRSQLKEFKEAIANCKQYPLEYFRDLESSLAYYDKIAGND